jgi:hypothetical protein
MIPDQPGFNTTVYNKRRSLPRNLRRPRLSLLVNAEHLAEIGIAQGDLVTFSNSADDHDRRLGGLHAAPYDIPRNMDASYFPDARASRSFRRRERSACREIDTGSRRSDSVLEPVDAPSIS